MKILILGLDGADPALLFGDDRLTHIRTLMEAGSYGKLESIVPPMTVPAWACLAASRDPGSIGVYGFRDRADRSYHHARVVDSRSPSDLTIWDQVAREGGRSILVGVPPGYPARKVAGVTVGCFLTPDPKRNVFTHPPELARRVTGLVGDYPVDVRDFRVADRQALLDEIRTMNRKQFAVFRDLVAGNDWQFAQIVAIGLDRLQHAFWSHHDPLHRDHDPASPFREAIRDFYRELDEEVGRILEGLDEETVVLICSDHGAQRLDGSFAVNEWLVREGLLVVNRWPDGPTPLARCDVDWARTTAWAEGGYFAKVHINVRGREPEGLVDPHDLSKVREDLRASLEATLAPDGRRLGSRVYQSEEVYREVRNVAPDLIVHFGGLSWRAAGGLGYGAVHVEEAFTGADESNHAQHGVFVLAGPGLMTGVEVVGAHLLDMAPTLLELAGLDVPGSMQGRSLAGSLSGPMGANPQVAEEDEDEEIRSRLGGLGYLS